MPWHFFHTSHEFHFVERTKGLLIFLNDTFYDWTFKVLQVTLGVCDFCWVLTYEAPVRPGGVWDGVRFVYVCVRCVWERSLALI